ncbi:MAG: hypothetical protein JWN09_473 [Microbacteriaceae bacterium]|jgi:hypothetical protein|nr:hypothetical protein [Microbacteriaceae bacterium]
MSDDNLTPPPPPPPSAPPASPYVAPAAGPKQTLSLVSFILGLAGLVFSWVFILGFLASLAAIILGFIAKSREPAAPKWMWLVGIITGFVAILISVIVIIIAIIAFASLSTVGNLKY